MLRVNGGHDRAPTEGRPGEGNMGGRVHWTRQFDRTFGTERGGALKDARQIWRRKELSNQQNGRRGMR